MDARPRAACSRRLELTALAAEAGFCVLGAAYPEPHPDSRGWAEDLAHLRAKVDAGVRVLVTQLYFDNDDYRRLVDRLRAGGIDVPVLPGIIPITSVGMIERIAALVRCDDPGGAAARARARQDDPRAVAELGVAYATAQAAELLERGRAGRAPVHAQQVTGDARDRDALRRRARSASTVAAALPRGRSVEVAMRCQSTSRSRRERQCATRARER